MGGKWYQDMNLEKCKFQGIISSKDLWQLEVKRRRSKGKSLGSSEIRLTEDSMTRQERPGVLLCREALVGRRKRKTEEGNGFRN